MSADREKQTGANTAGQSALIEPLEAWWGRDCLMPVAAVRYCLGRQTYIVSDCADWIIGCWHKIPKRMQLVIQRDIEEAFEHDDRIDSGYRALGANCDRQQWERVRALWASL